MTTAVAPSRPSARPAPFLYETDAGATFDATPDLDGSIDRSLVARGHGRSRIAADICAVLAGPCGVRKGSAGRLNANSRRAALMPADICNDIAEAFGRSWTRGKVRAMLRKLVESGAISVLCDGRLFRVAVHRSPDCPPGPDAFDRRGFCLTCAASLCIQGETMPLGMSHDNWRRRFGLPSAAVMRSIGPSLQQTRNLRLFARSIARDKAAYRMQRNGLGGDDSLPLFDDGEPQQRVERERERVDQLERMFSDECGHNHIIVALQRKISELEQEIGLLRAASAQPSAESYPQGRAAGLAERNRVELNQRVGRAEAEPGRAEPASGASSPLTTTDPQRSEPTTEQRSEGSERNSNTEDEPDAPAVPDPVSETPSDSFAAQLLWLKVVAASVSARPLARWLEPIALDGEEIVVAPGRSVPPITAAADVVERDLLRAIRETSGGRMTSFRVQEEPARAEASP